MACDSGVRGPVDTGVRTQAPERRIKDVVEDLEALLPEPRDLPLKRERAPTARRERRCALTRLGGLDAPVGQSVRAFPELASRIHEVFFPARSLRPNRLSHVAPDACDHRFPVSQGGKRPHKGGTAAYHDIEHE